MDFYKNKQYFKTKYSSLSTETFEDLFQDAIQKYLEDSLVKKIVSPKAYFGWLMQSKFSNYRKTQKNKKPIAKDLNLLESPNSPSPNHFKCIYKAVNNEIQALPPGQQLMAREHIFHDLTQFDIAEKHKLKYMTVKASLRHALTKLKKKLSHFNT